MNFISIHIHVNKENLVNSRISSIESFGDVKPFASLSIDDSVLIFDDVETIDKVITELKKARKGLAKATESGVL